MSAVVQITSAAVASVDFPASVKQNPKVPCLKLFPNEAVVSCRYYDLFVHWKVLRNCFARGTTSHWTVKLYRQTLEDWNPKTFLVSTYPMVKKIKC